MQKVNSNIEDDIFRKIMKEKLEGYSLPVNEDVWNKIERNLDKKPRKTILWSWISGTAVAAAVALFILLLYPTGDKAKQVNNYETTSSLSENAKTIDENVQSETVNQPVSTSKVKPERIFVTRKTKGEYAEVSSRPETDVIKEDVKNTHPEKSDRQETFVRPNPDPFGEDSPSIKKPKKRKGIGLFLGSGGSSPTMNPNSDNLMPQSVIGSLRSNFYVVESEPKTNKQLLKEDFPDISYRIPLSFGLTVKKELNRTFSLETGLIYTFLDTRFENRILERKALWQLHYIGIPLSVQARILGNKNSDWNIYLSAGGMIEKGIYSYWKQTNYVKDNLIWEKVINDRIDGLQYSLSFAPGIDYKIYRNYSIYLEPKISYYFDNKQPISTRTEHPFVIGINAGLRLCW